MISAEPRRDKLVVNSRIKFFRKDLKVETEEQPFKQGYFAF